MYGIVVATRRKMVSSLLLFTTSTSTRTDVQHGREIVVPPRRETPLGLRSRRSEQLEQVKSLLLQFSSTPFLLARRFFHRSTNLSDEDFLRLNRIFNRFFANAIRYEREQDFQLMEVFLKRSQAEEIRPSFAVKLLPPHHPTQLRSFATRLKPFPTLEHFALRSSSNPAESFLPPIRRRKTKSNEDNFISLPKKSKSKPEDLPSPVNVRREFFTREKTIVRFPSESNLVELVDDASARHAPESLSRHPVGHAALRRRFVFSFFSVVMRRG